MFFFKKTKFNVLSYDFTSALLEKTLFKKYAMLQSCVHIYCVTELKFICQIGLSTDWTLASKKGGVGESDEMGTISYKILSIGYSFAFSKTEDWKLDGSCLGTVLLKKRTNLCPRQDGKAILSLK